MVLNPGGTTVSDTVYSRQIALGQLGGHALAMWQPWGISSFKEDKWPMEDPKRGGHSGVQIAVAQLFGGVPSSNSTWQGGRAWRIATEAMVTQFA